MDYEKLLPQLKKYAKEHEKESRFEHTKGVVKAIRELADRYGLDPVKAEVIAWMHDTYKPAGPLEHGPMAAKKIQEDFGVTDPEILEAIEYHTIGRPGMCDLAKIMKLADMIEPNRHYPEVEKIRAAVTDNLNESLLMLMRETRKYVLANGGTYADISNQTIAWLEQELEKEMNDKELCLMIAKAIDAKKGRDIVILDIAEKSGFADYFVIATANNLRLLEALSDEIEDQMAKEERLVSHIEGKGDSGWILMDFGNIIVNLFIPEQREHYGIERIWKDCREVEFTPTAE